MWTQVAVIGSALVTAVLAISSVRVGFTFLVVPIVVCEALVLAVVYLLRQVLAQDDEASQARGVRQVPPRSAVAPPEQANRERVAPSSGAVPGRSVAPSVVTLA